MPWHLQVQHEDRVIEAVFEGHLSASELREGLGSGLQMAADAQIARFLADCSGLQGGHTLFDLLDGVGALDAFPLRAQFQEAVVAPRDPDMRLKAEFWETACVNRGLRVRLFETRAEALAWLRR